MYTKSQTIKLLEAIIHHNKQQYQQTKDESLLDFILELKRIVIYELNR